jgi:hypothetical protein
MCEGEGTAVGEKEKEDEAKEEQRKEQSGKIFKK